MAATGYTPISLYYSTTASAVPTSGNLANGELALNIADMKLYAKNSAGTVTLLASNSGATGTVSSVSGTGTVSGITLSGTVTSSGSLTLGGALDLSAYNGAGAFTTLSASGAVTLSGGTANGVTYLNGSKVLTSGSALTFDGNNFTQSGSNAAVTLRINTANAGVSASNYSEIELADTGSVRTFWRNLRDGSGATIFSGNNHIRYALLGSEQMRLTSTGLGIGTSSPATKLNVNFGALTSGTQINELVLQSNANGVNNSLNALTGITFYNRLSPAAYSAGSFNSSSGVYGINLDNSALGRNMGLVFYTSALDSVATEKMRLDSAGNLGLGVTPSAWSGYTALQVNNAISLWTSAGSSVYLSNNVYTDGVGRKYVFNGYASEYQSGSGAHYWKTAPSGTAGNPISFTQAMTLDASGRLLIGLTSAPTVASTLNLVAQSTAAAGITIAGRSSDNVGDIYFTSNAGTTTYGAIEGASNGLSLSGIGATNVIFGTNGAERARISSTGGFSVGTTANPGAGAIYATGAITAFYSDARLKTVSGKIENALDKVSKLSGVYYTNNDTAKSFGYTSDEVQVGVLAQEIEAVLPQVVKAAPFDLDENGNSKSGQNYKTVQYEKLVPLLIEAINELRAEVTALKGTI